MRTNVKRSRVFTGRPTQTRYLILLLVSMLIPTIFVGACLYYVIFTIMAEQLGIPESIAVNLFPVINKINLILLVAVPPIIVGLVIWGVFLSHRFVGPLERLEGELDKMVRGDHARRLRLRKTDDLKPIADRINALLDSVQRKK